MVLVTLSPHETGFVGTPVFGSKSNISPDEERQSLKQVVVRAIPKNREDLSALVEMGGMGGLGLFRDGDRAGHPRNHKEG